MAGFDCCVGATLSWRNSQPIGGHVLQALEQMAAEVDKRLFNALRGE